MNCYNCLKQLINQDSVFCNDLCKNEYWLKNPAKTENSSVERMLKTAAEAKKRLQSKGIVYKTKF